ncbi:MAG: hypothetical protein R3275_05700 [Saprospiraceae bacterium]|nr:hypothetical protein [Saprospiraceae bacterium]
MTSPTIVAKLPFENRLIRFLLFDLLIGLELSGIEVWEPLAIVLGIVAFYLLITSLIGYCVLHNPVLTLYGRLSGNDDQK